MAMEDRGESASLYRKRGLCWSGAIIDRPRRREPVASSYHRNFDGARLRATLQRCRRL